MTVNIDPSEVRSGGSSARPVAPRGPRLPRRAILLGGLGGAGLIAFSVGAFSFFSTLADPRVRLPRPMPAAASMPDLKDGMPALVAGEPAAKAATLNLPRPDAVEQTDRPQPPVEPQPVEQAAVTAPQVTTPQVTTLRTGPTPPPIQNAAILPETRAVTPVAPPVRTATTIAPARAETVKAKPGPAVASASSPDPVPEPTSTATAVAPPPVQAARKPVAAKPPVQKTAARKTPSTRTLADAAPDAAPVEASAASDESEIPGARQFRAGVKALGGLFGAEPKDD